MAKEQNRAWVTYKGKRCLVTVLSEEDGMMDIKFDGEKDDYCYPVKDVTMLQSIPKEVKVVSKIKLRNTFLTDAVRDVKADIELNKVIDKREYRGRIETITRKKYMRPDSDGYLVTEFTVTTKG